MTDSTMTEIPLVTRLLSYKSHNLLGEPFGPKVCEEAATAIQTLVEALEPFAEQPTIDDLLIRGDGLEYAHLTPEQRVELMGERKRQHDERIMRARDALASVKQGGV